MTPAARLLSRVSPATIGGRLALVIGLAVAPLCLLGVLLAARGLNEARDANLRGFEARALGRDDELRRGIWEIQSALYATASRAAAELEATGGCAQTIAEIEDAPWATRARIFDRSGVLTCGGEKILNISGNNGWRDFAAKPRLVFGDVRNGALTGAPIIVAYVPLPGGGVRHFALAVGVSLDHLANLSAAGGDKAVYLINAHGESVGADGQAANILPADRTQLMVFGDRMIEARGADGVARAYVTSEFANGQFWSVAAEPPPSAAALLMSEEVLSALLPALASLLAVLAAGLAARLLVTGHVERLRHLAERIGRDETGDAVSPSLRSAPLELRMLEETLRDMSHGLVERNASLAAANDVQKRLLLEIHHRVKNSLQTISSLMSLEARRLSKTGDPSVRHLFETLRGRLHGLALVHQHLYEAERLDDVDLDLLIRSIVNHQHATLKRSQQQTPPRLDLTPLRVETAIATPIALFVTEAVANAYKHGQTDDLKVEVALSATDKGFRLKVSNAENVAASGVAASKQSGLGMRLMTGFARQISGEMTTDLSDGRYVVTLEADVARRDLFALRKAA